MSDIIVWKRQDDSVSISDCPAGWKPEDWRDELIARARHDQSEADAGRLHVPEGFELASAQFLRETPVGINPSIVPHCEFRNAMVWDGKNVVHHMGRARELRREQLRRERAPVLDALDREFNKAVGTKNSKSADAIEAKRQRLRDVTAHPAIDKATTLDELRAVALPP
jgi:hypothetical protein